MFQIDELFGRRYGKFFVTVVEVCNMRKIIHRNEKLWIEPYVRIVLNHDYGNDGAPYH